jgi:hypothetical protein
LQFRGDQHRDRAKMKTPVVLVAVALTLAILLTASFLIATETRGDKGKAVIGEWHPQHLTMSSPAKAGDPVFQRRR